MFDLYEELHRAVRELDAAAVVHALVGGFAVSLHTRPRTTDDIDFLIAEADLDAAIAALTAAGFEARMAPFPVARGRLRIQRFLKTAEDEVLLIDALLAREPEHMNMLERRVLLESEAGRLWVVSREDLRTLEQLRGSPQDLASVQHVERALRRVAQLHHLFRRLPHLVSAREQQWIEEFEAFAAGNAPECSFAVLEAGFRNALRRRDATVILLASGRCGDWIQSDPELHPFYCWAERSKANSCTTGAASQPPRE